ncbi:MAG: NAD(+) synthase [Eubacteriales bacterium]
MHQHGLARVAAVTPLLRVADCQYNKNKIIASIKNIRDIKPDVLLFPELCITGYTCGDLFFQHVLLVEVEQCIQEICRLTANDQCLIVLGAPIENNHQLFNCAVVINRGKILGIVPKTYLPNYDEFYEKRWFSSACHMHNLREMDYCGQEVPFGTDILFRHHENNRLIVGIEICEDLWAPIPPSSYHCQYGATMILNPSASDELIGKSEYRKSLVLQQSARCISGYVYSSCGFGESTTDLVYGGHALICENGYTLKESSRFQYTDSYIYNDMDLDRIVHDRLKTNSFRDDIRGNNIKYCYQTFYTSKEDYVLEREISAYPFVPQNIADRNKRCEEIFNIQTMGLAKRITHVGTKSMVIGISGGLDSTLALLVCVKTCDHLAIQRKNITAITMPGFGTTDRTYTNAMHLMKNLGVNIREISITQAALQHFKDIGHDARQHDITYENTQARERTQILMDIANQSHGIVVGTGDLSELALGWATYNGDHMSMYAVNVGIPKTLVRYLVQWIADYSIEEKAKEILFDILDTPVSPELLPPDSSGNISQKTEEVVGPYELHDFFLFHVVRYGYSPKKIWHFANTAFKGKYDAQTILKWMKNFYKRFFSQQFKRSCIPDGPKVGTISLSPRGDWRMPSDASSDIWLKEMDEIIP